MGIEWSPGAETSACGNSVLLGGAGTVLRCLSVMSEFSGEFRFGRPWDHALSRNTRRSNTSALHWHCQTDGSQFRCVKPIMTSQ